MNIGPNERHKAGRTDASDFLSGKKSIWPDPPLNWARAGVDDLHKSSKKKCYTIIEILYFLDFKVRFQCFSKTGTTSVAESSGFKSHRSLTSKGFRKPFQVILSNQANTIRDRKLAPSSGHGF